MRRGEPTGSAMPLCWAHAEYLTLVRSRKDGVCFDRIQPVYERYAQRRTGSTIEMWTLAHRPPKIRRGKNLRVITGIAGTVRWSFDGWAKTNEQPLIETELGCWYADLPASSLAGGAKVVFTFQRDGKQDGRDYQVEIL
jgi:glucoamylase